MTDFIQDESGIGILDEGGAPISPEGYGYALPLVNGQLAVLDHITDARNRLLQQYRHSPRLIALQEALFGRQMQELELSAHQLYGRLDIDNCQGVQLDRIGGIVGLSRSGWSDILYKILLKAKIGANTSRGIIEDVISVWRILAQAGRVQVVETYPAQIDLYSDTPILGDIASFVRTLMQKVVSAGVRVDFLAIIFSATNAFGLAGDDENIGGFGDYYDAEAGGELSYIQLTQ